MVNSRRDFIRLGLGTAAGSLVAGRVAADPMHEGHQRPDPETPVAARPKPAPSRSRGSHDFVPVETPDVAKLPWTMAGGVKVFHLVAEVVQTQFVPWRTANTWGYNGSTPGPTIEAMEGDRVRIVVDNRLPEATTMHWHGLEVPNAMDGVEGISQDFIPPGGRFVYEFTLRQNGTFFYHSHRPMQQMMGMIGAFIIHPRRPYEPRVDRDYAWILQEWAALPNNPTPNSLAMEFNWLTMNGKAAPATTPALCRLGERVRLRFINIGMDHHPMHLHGHTWVVTGTEGGRIPRALWQPGNTELVGVAQARVMEFEANNPGDWMLHCHLPHHMMNAMVSMVGPLSEPVGGVPTGERMEDGMGMLNGGHALSDKYGPSMGRATGIDSEQRVTNAPLGSAGEAAAPAGPAGPSTASANQGGMSGMSMPAEGAQPRDSRGGEAPQAAVEIAPNARQVPGYPQDMFMAMDEAVAKPETHGLRPSWSGGMMGMMTLVRVLQPGMFQEIQRLQSRQPANPQPAQPMSHEHHGAGGGR